MKNTSKWFLMYRYSLLFESLHSTALLSLRACVSTSEHSRRGVKRASVSFTVRLVEAAPRVARVALLLLYVGVILGSMCYLL